MVLLIRPEQMQALESAQIRQFERQLCDHLHRLVPRHAQVLGPERLEQAVKFGLSRAGTLGFSRRGPARFYVELTFLFGSYFDTDPQYALFSDILSDHRSTNQMHRADLLHSRVCDYLTKTSGADRMHVFSALERSYRFSPEISLAIEPDTRSNAYDSLWYIFPEKCDYLGATPIQRLIDEASNSCAQRFSSYPPHILTFVLFSFAMGHRFFDDPLHPWVSTTLSRYANANEAFSHLVSKGHLYLRHALGNPPD